MQGEDNKKRGGRELGAAANAWKDLDTGSVNQSGSNLCNGGKGKEWIYRHMGDNYVVISLQLVSSLVHCLDIAATNLAFNKLLKMSKLVR